MRTRPHQEPAYCLLSLLALSLSYLLPSLVEMIRASRQCAPLRTTMKGAGRPSNVSVPTRPVPEFKWARRHYPKTQKRDTMQAKQDTTNPKRGPKKRPSSAPVSLQTHDQQPRSDPVVSKPSRLPVECVRTDRTHKPTVVSKSDKWPVAAKLLHIALFGKRGMLAPFEASTSWSLGSVCSMPFVDWH